MKQEPISYLVGSVVVITGCRSDMVLDGSTSYACRMREDTSTYWDPEVDTVCKGMVTVALGSMFFIFIYLFIFVFGKTCFGRH